MNESDNEATMAKAQKLMAAGKMQEGLALLEKMKESMHGGKAFAGSPQAVDSWIECLEEMNEAKYPVSIRISR